jgi:hypothetical protein
MTGSLEKFPEQIFRSSSPAGQKRNDALLWEKNRSVRHTQQNPVIGKFVQIEMREMIGNLVICWTRHHSDPENSGNSKGPRSAREGRPAALIGPFLGMADVAARAVDLSRLHPSTAELREADYIDPADLLLRRLQDAHVQRFQPRRPDRSED